MFELLPYDVIFTVCPMPEMNGYDAATEIGRREGPNRHIAIVAATTEGVARLPRALYPRRHG